MAGDDVTIVITANNGQAIRAFRDVNGQLRDMSGRFVSEGNTMSGAMNRVSSSIMGVRGSIIPLAAAAVPLAAALAPVAAKAAGAGLAVAAFGAAVAGQVSSLSEAAEAQKKYTDAVTAHGRGSQQAAEAQRAVAQTLASMPQSTARAAVALGTLKDGFSAWSDEMADFTMTPVEKSFAVLGQVIPQLTPMVQGASAELDRLVTVAGGAVASPGFDALSEKVSTFANSALKDAVDGVISFTRALSEGDATGPVKTFMEYAEKNGPALRETLTTVGTAVSTLVEAAADAGPGMLTLVNAAAGLVAALPPGLVTVLMQTAVALKAVSLAGAAATAIAGGVGTLGARIAAMGAASAAAGGGLAGLNAALNTLGTGGKAMLAAGAIGALVLAMHQLSDNKGPVAVEKLSTSLNTLLSTGKVTGELKSNFREMSESIAMVSKGASDNKLAQLTSDFGTFVGISTGPGISDARKNVDAWDKSMASLVKSGNPEQAAAQFELLKKAWVAGGGDLDRLKKFTDDYNDALADQKFEAQMAIESMGIFGQAAADTSAKLEAQQVAADGLRASILALNDVNRSAHDAQTQFEGALDSLTASFKEHGATLNADTEAGRANRDAMSAASAAQGELIATGLAAGDSLASMTGKSEKLRGEMMRLAVEAFGGNKKAAAEYVNTLLGTPSEVKTLIKAEKDQAITGLADVQAAIEKTPGAKSIKVDTLNGAAIAALEAVGLKTKQLKDGRTQVFTANGQALGSIGAVSKALRNLNGRTAKTYTTHTIRTINEIITRSKTYRSVHDIVGATGGLFTGKSFKRGYADGGLVEGPGTETSDDVFAPWLSKNEFVVNAKSARKHMRLLRAINDDRLREVGLAKGGKLSDSEQQARKELAGFTSLSYFSRNAGFRNNEFIKGATTAGSVGELVGVMNQMASLIKKASHGSAEAKALRAIGADGSGNPLWRYQRNLESVNKSLEKAKDKLDKLKDSASQLSSSVKSGIISGANITKAAGGDGQVTINTLLSQMTGSAANSKQFAGMLKSLKGRGLRGDLIEQIAEAGIEGGGMETAAAILGGGTGEIKKLNDLQKQITSAAGAAGKTASDAMYGAGIKASEGLVKGLQKQQDKIEAQMMKIAKSMEKAIKKALGIRSPSKVMEQIGDQTAEGFAVGMTRNRSVTPAWASMLTTPRGGSGADARRTATASGAGGDRPIVLNVKLGDREFGQIWVDIGRKEVSTRGGLQATLGGTT